MGNSCAKKPVRVKTSSVCTTKAATGTHSFMVMNYSLLDGMGVGKFVTSSTFNVGGQDWCIRFYPDGDGRAPGYVGAFLCPCGDVAETGVRVYYTLSLRMKDGGAYSCSTPLTATYTFTSRSGDGGVGKIKLLRKSYLPRNGFRIRCDLTVVQSTNVQMMLLPN
ncbi:unnamed protein product [Alopecurus aequalis]